MIDPNERLKRIWERTCEDLDMHADRKQEASDFLENTSICIKSSDRYLINYFYHDGYLNAIQYIRRLFRMWEGTKEEWFKLIKPHDENEE